LRGLKYDKSGATGESDAIQKLPYDQCIQLQYKAHGDGLEGLHTDCFVISGSKVLVCCDRRRSEEFQWKNHDGCVSVSSNPVVAHNLDAVLRTDSENTPLQSKVNSLAEFQNWNYRRPSTVHWPHDSIHRPASQE
jgi:Ca2+-transporting ATPase